MRETPSDCFLAKVVSFSSVTFKGKVKPMFTEADGTEHPEVEAKSAAGVTPSAGDVVLVVTSRNNLDDGFISRYFGSSESNCRIIHVVKKNGQNFVFTGNYKFVGNVEVDGDLKVTGDLDIEGDTTVDGKLDVAEDVNVDGDLDVGGNMIVDGTARFGGIGFGTHTHLITAPGTQSGPPTGPP